MLVSSSLYGVFALAAALFCRMLGVFIVLPVAAPLVAARPDGSAIAAGLVLGGYGLTQALMQLPTGMLADRIGKKPVLLAALALFAIGGFAAAAADTVAGIVAGRLLQGMGAVAAVSAAWITDIAPPERRAPALAAFGAVIALAFVVSLFAAPLAAGAYGLSGIFSITGWLGVASFLLVLTLPPPPAAAAAADSSSSGGAATLFTNRRLLEIGAGAFILHYALATLFFLLPSALPMEPAQHWRVYAASFVAALPLAGWLIMRVDKRPTLCVPVAIALVFAGCTALPAATQLPGALLALFLFFSGFMTLEAALPALAARAAPDARRAGAMGIVMTCEFAGVFCGGAAAGLLSSFADNIIVVVVVCALIAVWLLRYLQNEYCHVRRR